MSEFENFRPDPWQSFKRRKGRALLIFAAFFLFVAVFGVVNMTTGARLVSDGRVAEARVMGSEVSQQIRHNAQNNLSTTYAVDLRFETEDGEIVETTQTLPGDVFREVAGSVTTEVTYLPSDPHVIEIEPGATQASGRIAAIFGGVGLLAVLAALTQVLLQIRAEGQDA